MKKRVEMLGGSETRGATTTTYGADWEVVSTVTTVDTDSGNFTELTSDDLHAFPKCVYISHWCCR